MPIIIITIMTMSTTMNTETEKLTELTAPLTASNNNSGLFCQQARYLKFRFWKKTYI